MAALVNMASKLPLPTISPTITGSATIGPPPISSTMSDSFPFPSSTAFPGHPAPHRVFEHATKLGHVTLWIVFAAFVIITLIFMLMTIRIQKHLRLFHYLTILITLTAALSYFVMAQGGGHSFHLVRVIHHKHYPTELIFRPIYWARYLEWAITSSLVLLDLTFLAGLPGAQILLALYADIAMILFGLFAAFSHHRSQWGYYAISCVMYLYIIFTLVMSSRRAAIARNARVGRMFTAISLYTIIVWSMYPIVWILGSGTQRISVNGEIIWFAVLDLLSKGVFGGWLLVSHLRIQEGHVPLTGWWIEGSGSLDGTTAERRRLLDED